MSVTERQNDPSTLAALHPTHPDELHFKTYKNAMRLGGSLFMSLRRPSRAPESGREYVQGDPVSMIDWKAFARTDQLIVREVRDEAASRVMVVLDASETMQWPDKDVPLAHSSRPPTKAEVATRVALNLAYIHQRLGDLVEIWLALDAKANLPKRRLRVKSSAEIASLFERLLLSGFSPAAFEREWPTDLFEEKKRDLVYLVTDGLSQLMPELLFRESSRTCFVHLLSSLEDEIDWIDSDTSYFDEGLGRREYQGQVLRQKDNYHHQLRKWRERLLKEQKARGGYYLSLTDRTSLVRYHGMLTSLTKP